ncbi:hypothetical protein ACLHDG_10275 [Sulfurovum sp. CS9]|uniref:hypothetical protein n=1 Tax=Sulfurovum sp. CS9 TaxID=3391146 RepID=UPI0039E7ECBF
MKQFDKKKIGFFTIIVMVLLVFSSGAVAAETDKLFNGLWEGIDPDDGSTVQVSIVCSKKSNGECRMIARESYLHSCEINGEAGGEGWYVGTGKVATDNKRRLNIEWTIYCKNGRTLEVKDNLIIYKAEKILILRSEGIQDLTLHRVSN